MMQETNQNHHVHIFHSFFEHNESPLLSHYAFMINIINLFCQMLTLLLTLICIFSLKPHDQTRSLVVMAPGPDLLSADACVIHPAIVVNLP